MMNDEDNQQISKSDDTPPALLEHALLPAYLSEIFTDLYEEDGLAVLARGLGQLHLMATFCRFYVQEEQHELSLDTPAPQTKSPVIRVFVLGLREQERQALVTILESWGTPPTLLPTIITNESGQSQERIQLYSRGGIFVITSRILIVDLLSGVIDASSIDGFLVAHAESISEQSTESFILRLFRTQRKWSSVIAHGDGQGGGQGDTHNARAKSLGFIKAFTDAPDALLSGFAKVDKVLKALFVCKFYLYPRNHERIADELEQYPPKVEGVSIPLTPCLKEMQSALAACVQVGNLLFYDEKIYGFIVS